MPLIDAKDAEIATLKALLEQAREALENLHNEVKEYHYANEKRLQIQKLLLRFSDQCVKEELAPRSTTEWRELFQKWVEKEIAAGRVGL